MKPACMRDEMLDLRFMDYGLKGDGVTACTICTDVLREDIVQEESRSMLVSLPCMHVFQKECLVSWFGSDLGGQKWNCPTCRSAMPWDTSTYVVDYKNQLQKRVNELSFVWLLHQMSDMDHGTKPK